MVQYRTESINSICIKTLNNNELVLCFATSSKQQNVGGISLTRHKGGVQGNNIPFVSQLFLEKALFSSLKSRTIQYFGCQSFIKLPKVATSCKSHMKFDPYRLHFGHHGCFLFTMHCNLVQMDCIY